MILRFSWWNMRNGYVDHYVICPLYSREESDVIRKIHCAGHKKGVYVQMYFKKRELKREHKRNFCKKDYRKCPLYQGVLDYLKEKGDEQIP